MKSVNELRPIYLDGADTKTTMTLEISGPNYLSYICLSVYLFECLERILKPKKHLVSPGLNYLSYTCLFVYLFECLECTLKPKKPLQTRA